MVASDLHNLFFGTYMSYEEEKADQFYDEIDDISSFEKIVQDCLREYNNVGKSSLNMVIFRYDAASL